LHPIIQIGKEGKELTVKATIAAERDKKPYLAMPSERTTKVLAIPNIILQRIAQRTTPAAPNRKRLFLLKKASSCKTMASRYRVKAEVTAAVGFSRTFLALKPRFSGGLEEKNLKTPIRLGGWKIGGEWRKEERRDLGCGVGSNFEEW